MPLYASVHVSPSIPWTAPNGKPGGPWSPIACTLIHTSRHAVLVDTPITVSQTEALITWIEQTLQPGATLEYIYITHGHGDHWFGLNMLLQKFPTARAVATQGTIAHMQGQIEPRAFKNMWGSRFPGQIDVKFKLAEPLPQSGTFYLPLDGNDRGVHGGGDEGVTSQGYTFQAIEVGHTDTHSSTVLFCPHLRLVCAGDVVYGDVHQMLGEANTHALRMEWVRAVDTVSSLSPRPEIVVPGHVKAQELCGAWHLDRTRRYLLDFDALVEGGDGDGHSAGDGLRQKQQPKNARELVARMKELWPTRFNDGALIVGAINAFKVKEKEAANKAKASGGGGKL
ncbi:uncharacterized protein Z520_06082 [Fonsecaea multimorphosa CBS 102226]|uniref:Metallo-beta-lactamase domain-containing protein n=1 Tax=Fonsecaea multimorphosa CBS 102226 TaxID=1442371 RepID=A0A0D2KMU7_9EURO|nr:uncharacterized protein Z520_06082 [Fonsecaea multimorphosa CBS 102226]KIX98003.1 hypothetical protein Z520_06082 [Fonsecaea multimorphosa CBS 102226]OAL24372.1 hypothetical protein AYO22_05748 [Fonsecaea multimorphosa]